MILTANCLSRRDRVVFEVQMGKFAAPLEIVELIKILHIVTLEVKHLQMLQESNIEQLVNLVVANV